MSQSNLNRRDFAKQLAWTTGAASLALQAAGTSQAADPKNNTQSPPPPEPPEPIDPLQTQAELLQQVLLLRYPDERLTPEKLAEIRDDIESDLARSRILSSYALQNDDHPAFIFRPYRARSAFD